MRVRQFHHSCVFTSGLLVAALAVDCSISSVSYGQLASSARSTSVVNFIDATAYVDLPSTNLDEESSQSSSIEQSKGDKETKASYGANASSKQLDNNDIDAAKSAKDDRETITPMQNRELTIRVQAVSIAHEKIGTGLVPMSGSPRSTDQVILPTGISRGMQYTHVCWRASNIRYFPLYFEDAMLERHGHTRCFLGFEVAQSLVSGAKFFGTIPLLPYLGTLRPRRDCVYALGHYRPGSCAPCLRDNIPYDARAAIVESASAAAFFWAVPL